jgi:hypothetical protein
MGLNMLTRQNIIRHKIEYHRKYYYDHYDEAKEMFEDKNDEIYSYDKKDAQVAGIIRNNCTLKPDHKASIPSRLIRSDATV